MTRLLLAICLLVSALQGTTNEQLLAAIKQVEGVRDPAKVGPAGELGFYRITPAVWVQHSRQPFSLCATMPAIEAAVALQHVKWLREHLRDPSDYRVALAWNAGLSAVNRGREPARSRDYARRVVNLLPAGSAH